MIKYFLIFIYSLLGIFIKLFLGDSVTVNQKVPDKTKIGEEFITEITIKKENISGFAKLQFDLPSGFKVREVEVKNANFTFNERTVKLIWTSLPTENEFTIKLGIVAESNVSGKKAISGKFSYIQNNVKQQVEFGPTEFEVINPNISALVEESIKKDSTDSNKNSNPNENTASNANQNPEEKDGKVACVRKITAVENGAFEVQFKINKEGIKGFAKLIDRIPQGYQCAGLQTAGGSFSCFENSAKFVWVALPASDLINVSYRLVPLDPTIQNAGGNLNGEFSYLQNEQTFTLKIPEEKLPQTDLANTVIKEETKQKVETEDNIVAKETPENEKEKVNREENTLTSKNEVAKENSQEITNSNINQSKEEKLNPQIKSETSVSFRVQIGAFRKGIETQVLSKKFKITEEISTDQHDGFTKCLIGNYKEYKEAKNKKEGVKQKGATDAFVAAYNSGKRITVQEALMISNQSWLK